MELVRTAEQEARPESSVRRRHHQRVDNLEHLESPPIVDTWVISGLVDSSMAPLDSLWAENMVSPNAELEDFVDSISDDAVREAARNREVVKYYSRLLGMSRLLLKTKRSEMAYVQSHEVQGLPYHAEGEQMTHLEHLRQLSFDTENLRYTLRVVIDECRTLRNIARNAATEGLLDEDTLDSLKAKLTALQVEYRETDDEDPHEDLIDPASPQWW
ncbi:MAG: hypothetical protein Q9159_000146 [Coniocarpon cinnabarinum]